MEKRPPDNVPTSDEPDQLDLYTIPSYSSWFSWNDIHEVERFSLREFFDGSSFTRTPKIYKEYRDFIITKYREDPTRNLTFTHIRKSLVGDVTVLNKVFTFLEKWGLINFDSKNKNNNSGSDIVVGGDEEGKWRVTVEEGAPHGVRVVAAPNSLKPVVAPVAGNGGAVEDGLKLPHLASYLDVYGELVKKVKEEKEALVCKSCGDDCSSGSAGHYEYTKQDGSFSLCEKCFKIGTYEKDKSVDDFKFIANGNHGAVWTEAETLLLLESVLKHGDNWQLVAQNVKTKSKLDCISKLIQLPFGDLTLASVHRDSRVQDINGDLDTIKQMELVSGQSQATLQAEGQNDDHKDECQQNGDPDMEAPPRKRVCTSPISDGSISLIEQVAHISTIVGPHITASAADAAVTALCYENQCPREILLEDDDYNEELGSSPENSKRERFLQVENVDTVEKHTESGTPEKSSKRNTIPLTLRIKGATATALGAAAARAKLLADQEEREIEYLVATIIETQVKKMKQKVRHIEDLQQLMEKQHDQIEKLEESLLAERISYLQRVFDAGMSRGNSQSSGKPQNGCFL